MSKPTGESIEHLTWLVERRSRNQHASMKLLAMMDGHKEKLALRKYSITAQALAGVAFSLWRSVFLADKTGDKGASLGDATQFLKTLISDNAINYPQDRKAKEWTFNYYILNASVRLNNVADDWKYPFSRSRKKAAKDRWDYWQGELEKAIERFSQELEKPTPISKSKN